MGFLDRFSRDSNTPDAFTIEVVARIRALDTVEHAEAVDGDTVAVTWVGRSEPERIDIGETRAPWKQTRGFDRIELMDDFIARLSPAGGSGVTGLPDLGLTDPAPQEPTVAAPPPSDSGWAAIRGGVLPVLRRRHPSGDGAVAWPVGELLEATAATGAGVEPVTTAQCNEWGVDPAEVRRAASENLRAIDSAPDPIADRAWIPTNPAELQSSWLAAPAVLLERIGVAAGIVLVPLSSELVVVDPADTDTVQTILTSTLTILETQSDTLCPVPFLVTGDDVDVWHPAEEHPAAELVKRTHELFSR